VPLSREMIQPQKVPGECPDPLYPDAARNAGITGVVLIKVTISREGTVEDAKIVDGSEIFQQAALDAVKKWKYTPASFNGRTIAVTMMVRVNFTLR
jgi:protein TonB